MMTRQFLTVGGALLALALAGCPKEPEVKPTPPPVAGPTASADIRGPGGSKLTGKASFQQRENKVAVRVEVQGAPPGEHGVHVHEKGDCSDPEFKSAGGHFNPTGVNHGGPNSPVHHPGDFGNMVVKEDGTGVLELETDLLTVPEGTMSVVGKSIIVHEKPDDLTTQPTGNAGGRIGCGEIRAGSQ
jgi:Cu-Zn family superoxide dismutase